MFRNEITKRQNRKRILFCKIFDLIIFALSFVVSASAMKEFGLFNIHTIFPILVGIISAYFIFEDFSV